MKFQCITESTTKNQTFGTTVFNPDNMNRFSCLLIFTLYTAIMLPSVLYAQKGGTSGMITPFEQSEGRVTATYDEVISFYKQLTQFPGIIMDSIGKSDAGTPMYVVYYSPLKAINQDRQITILINNGIHPGEPDGVDACMMLLRNAATGKIKIPRNITLAVIPIYNVDGALNRSCCSRANQNGPEAYGFRPNSHNLDLNRDFIKCDASETDNLEQLFARLDPDIFIDNHVSDGADYQHVMTLLTSQHDKAGGTVGDYSYRVFTPLLFADMKKRGYDLVPYVNDFSSTPDHGWREFYEPPRFSSGYAALFQCFAFVPETHMLKPFKQRVAATYDLMLSFIDNAAAHAAEIKTARRNDRSALRSQQDFPLEWQADTTRCDSVKLLGYTAGYKPSEISGLPRLFYDHEKPFSKNVPFFNHYTPSKTVRAPKAYVIPQAWSKVIDLLQKKGTSMTRFTNDTEIKVTAYKIENYETAPKPYEGHYLHRNVQVSAKPCTLKFRAGDYIVSLNQPAKRYLVETLEPTAPDAFFSWNFFDGTLQQKEYFSDYVFEDVAAQILRNDPVLQAELNKKKAEDHLFAESASAQLEFVYRHSFHMEQSYMRYPVYRVE